MNPLMTLSISIYYSLQVTKNYFNFLLDKGFTKIVVTINDLFCRKKNRRDNECIHNLKDIYFSRAAAVIPHPASPVPLPRPTSASRSHVPHLTYTSQNSTSGNYGIQELRDLLKTELWELISGTHKKI